MIVAAIAHLAGITASTYRSAILTDPEGPLWGLSLTPDELCLCEDHFLWVRFRFLLVIKVCNWVHPGIYTLHLYRVMTVCGHPLALISITFGEVRFQADAEWVDWLHKWSIQTLAYQAPVSMLRDQALAYLFYISPTSTGSCLLIVCVTSNNARRSICSILDSLPALPLIRLGGTYTVISMGAFPIMRKIGPQSDLLEGLWIHWTLSRNYRYSSTASVAALRLIWLGSVKGLHVLNIVSGCSDFALQADRSSSIVIILPGAITTFLSTFLWFQKWLILAN